MDTDANFFEAVKENREPPSVRFYKWQRPAVSYGRTQGLDVSTQLDSVSKGRDVVRRPTGGGKVLHGDDLCFSVFWRKEHGSIPWKIQESYRQIHIWIKESLNSLGLPTSLMEENAPNIKGWCFQNPSGYDLVSDGKKVVGGAQRRDGNTALHQGSIQLNIQEKDLSVFKNCFASFFHVEFDRSI